MNNDKTLVVEFHNHLLMDRINILAMEYSLPVNFIVNVAVKKLLEDVETLRQLRNNTYKI